MGKENVEMRILDGKRCTDKIIIDLKDIKIKDINIVNKKILIVNKELAEKLEKYC